jgi:hypothetical protein
MRQSTRHFLVTNRQREFWLTMDCGRSMCGEDCSMAIEFNDIVTQSPLLNHRTFCLPKRLFRRLYCLAFISFADVG